MINTNYGVNYTNPHFKKNTAFSQKAQSQEFKIHQEAIPAVGSRFQKQNKNSNLFSCCRPMATLKPILWLPMAGTEHN
jgi:hypothetical protein